MASWRFDSKSDTEFEKSDLAFLQGAANLLGMAIERERHERNLNAALDRQQLLLKEMNHRVKNSLATVCSMLGLQARQEEPQVAKRLQEAIRRITAIARAYEFLYQGADVERMDIGKYIEATCRGLDESFSKVTVHVEVDYEIYIATDDAISAALIVNELATNAAKYAYPDGPGEISVTVAHLGDGGFCISVCDDGVGLPTDFDPNKSKGLGMRIVRAFTQQLRGKLEIHRRDPGTEFVVAVPNPHRELLVMADRPEDALP